MSYYHFVFLRSPKQIDGNYLTAHFDAFLRSQNEDGKGECQHGSIYYAGEEVAQFDLNARGEDNFEGDLDLTMGKASRFRESARIRDLLSRCDLEICFTPRTEFDSVTLTEFIEYLTADCPVAVIGFDSAEGICDHLGEPFKMLSIFELARDWIVRMKKRW